MSDEKVAQAKAAFIATLRKNTPALQEIVGAAFDVAAATIDIPRMPDALEETMIDVPLRRELLKQIGVGLDYVTTPKPAPAA